MQDFETGNEQDYLKRKNIPHIFHTFEWMRIIKETLNVKCKIAILKENNTIVASIPFVYYRNLFKGQLPLQFSGYYGSIFVKRRFKEKYLVNF